MLKTEETIDVGTGEEKLFTTNRL